MLTLLTLFKKIPLLGLLALSLHLSFAIAADPSDCNRSYALFTAHSPMPSDGSRLHEELSVLQPHRDQAVGPMPDVSGQAFELQVPAIEKSDGLDLAMIPATKLPEELKTKVDPKTVERFRGTLTQSERATIFLNLIDNNEALYSVLFSELKAVSADAHKQVPNKIISASLGQDGRLHWSGYGRFSDHYMWSGYKPERFAELAFNVLDASAMAQQAASKVSFRLWGEAPWQTESRPGLTKFRDFFEWLHESDERVKYARYLTKITVESLYEARILSGDSRSVKFRKLALDPRSSIAKTIGSPSRLVKIISGDARKLAYIRLHKIDLGYATGALSDAVHSNGVPEYEAIPRSFANELAPVIKKLNDTSLLIDNIAHYDTLANLQTTATKALAEMVEVSQKAKDFADSADIYLKKMKSSANTSNAATLKENLAHLDALNDQINRLGEDQQEIEHYFTQLQWRMEVFKSALKSAQQAPALEKTEARLEAFNAKYMQNLNVRKEALEHLVENLRDLHQQTLHTILDVMD